MNLKPPVAGSSLPLGVHRHSRVVRPRCGLQTSFRAFVQLEGIARLKGLHAKGPWVSGDSSLDMALHK